MTCHVSSSSKAIQGQMRSPTSYDLEWSFFSWVRFWGILECFNLFWLQFTHYSRLSSISKEVVSTGPLRVFDLTSEVISWPETWKVGTIGFFCWAQHACFFPWSSNYIRGRTVVGSDGPSPCTFDAVKSRTRARIKLEFRITTTTTTSKRLQPDAIVWHTNSNGLVQRVVCPILVAVSEGCFRRHNHEYRFELHYRFVVLIVFVNDTYS